MKNQIQLVLKENIRDVLGEKIEKNAAGFLHIRTGKVKTGKIFNITYELTDDELARFANLGLKDEISRMAISRRLAPKPVLWMRSLLVI